MSRKPKSAGGKSASSAADGGSIEAGVSPSTSVEVRGRGVGVIRKGKGAPLIWLHGFADVHGAAGGLLPIHEQLARTYDVIVPAHPGCATTDERDDLDSVHDVAEQVLDLADVLGLDTFHLAGACVGGWVAAEVAVRQPQRVKSLSLVGATGLFVSGQPIADIFWVAQPEDGMYYNDLRHMLFAAKDSPAGVSMFPDGKGEIAQELLRYRMFRFASQIGFAPPYLHNRKLIDQLHRYKAPARVIWGEHDHMVPRAHAEAYAKGLAGAKLEIVKGAGHSVHVEKPEAVAKVIAGLE
jgi:pimeloyl-ACP methyl ester carboxylesterase